MFIYRDENEPCLFSLDMTNLLRRLVVKNNDIPALHTLPSLACRDNSQGSPSSCPQGEPVKVKA